LTPEPIHETTYRDTTVKPGVTYVYAVEAVDNAPVPNVSAPSNKASEVAR
jgi:fibronectin type 3 domain-containing protein